ncbi:MAG: hypothetical protein ABIP55_12025 [Tepidisphaeraceae bacterium]
MERDVSDIRQARHHLRGQLNALKLCVSAFQVLENDKQTLEFLDMVEQAADRTAGALDALETAVDRSMGVLP